MNDEEILTKEELAKLLKVGIRTIDRLRKDGMPYFNIGSSVRFRKENVLKWLENKKK